MSVEFRAMRPKDVRHCVELVARHPIVGPRYEGVLDFLGTVWLQLLGTEAFRAVVFEQVDGQQVYLLGPGTSAFVSDDFVAECRRPPFFWIGPELARRVHCGKSPLLSDKEVREANSGGGLNLVVWEGCTREDANPEVINRVVSAFVEQHQGFFIKEWVTQVPGVQALVGTINSGAFLIDPADGRYVTSVETPLAALLAKPHCVGLTRELAKGRVGSWLGSLFLHQRPRCGFRASEQRLLLAALTGATDDTLADELGISVSAVKKSWRAIYARVGDQAPELVPGQSSSEASGKSRGKEKKQRLLAYLRVHPEELRPISRKLFVRDR
jgi:hypothetical protein